MTSKASSGVIGGMIEGRHRASSVFPQPGAPINTML